jgi:hypothetical protein
MTVVSAEAASSPTYNPTFSYTAGLERAPYVTDLEQTTAELNWAVSYNGKTPPTPGYATYGPTGNCTQSKVQAGKTLPAFQPNVDTANAQTPEIKAAEEDYQFSVQLGPLSPSTTYCYEVFTSTGTALAASQSFTTLDSATSTTPLTFDVIGDFGETAGADESTSGVNEDQAAIMDEIGSSGAKFILGAGDEGYPNGSDTNYGDLSTTGTDTSAVFGPAYWPQTGGIPFFSADGNHGENITTLRTSPEEQTAKNSGGVYAYDSYPANSIAPVTSSPDNWYAFSDAGVRIYVLDSAWSDGTTYLGSPGVHATGSACNESTAAADLADCGGYQIDDSEHWQPTSAEMEWLKADLAAHPGGIKMAVFHYPLQSLNNTQPSDPYTDNDLEPVLKAGGVSIVFNGHAHTYQRFTQPGFTSYVTGGGGGSLEPVDGTNDKTGKCAAAVTSGEQVYALGLGSSGVVDCGQTAPLMTKNSAGAYVVPGYTAAQVYNFLKVTVNNGQVTVTPENALGQPFDPMQYGTVTPPTTTTTTSTTSGSGGGTVKLVTSAGASGATVSLPQAATKGDLLVYSASQYTGATNHITAVSDNAGDKWTLLQAPYVATHNSEGELWYTYATGSVSTVTATTKATSIASEVQVFSGVPAGTVPASGSGSADSNAASSSASGSGLEVGFVAGHGNSEAITLGAGLTPQPQVPSAAGTSISTLTTGYETSGGTGTFSGTFPTAMYWASGVAVFPAG